MWIINSLSIRIWRRKSKKSWKKTQYNPEVERRLDVARRLFQKYDTDGSGFLSENEVVGLIKDTYAEMGMKNYTPSTDDVKIWLQMSDSNQDGTVSLEEYEDLVIKSLQKAGIKVEQQRIVF
ncbi:hypothetical protein IMG5_054770 [Ichthyophthirius multifiliis]|uniref:EF-hand domain-containing protein n=1 Tax=Ichthyophthirius multifiliis TaxID=5932 RepID=G0QN24_ICHMU|nr:hypothetical protein IMG5_054770 [Ichthyophthirius multifiliis]EGR33387.1 hypothetical protein IMG5_054770 [Ichthyophthirius multifiliis]|eukprot:XP_004037373.1 hypothetical protein IMG5_054770 [Ichthyophthirius multifiliis]